MPNNIEFLKYIVERLGNSGINTVVFGGWAKELLKIIPARKHIDIDLLYIGDSFDAIDFFLESQKDLIQIKGKRFDHKRAFLCNGIMIELLLVKYTSNQWITSFWGDYNLKWPHMISQNITIPEIGNIPVTHSSLIKFYQKKYSSINLARNEYTRKLPLNVDSFM